MNEPSYAYVPILKCSHCGTLLEPSTKQCPNCNGHVLLDGMKTPDDKFILPNGSSPIEEKFLEIGNVIKMEFRDNHIFGRVKNVTHLRYKPYHLIDYYGHRIEIGSDMHQNELRMNDPLDAERDLLYLQDDFSYYNSRLGVLLHGSIGIRPNNVLMYIRLPEAKVIQCSLPDRVTRPDKGDVVGSITGLDSPYHCPTTASEMWIPPKTHAAFEFFNKGNKIICPILNLRFVIYEFEFISRTKESRIVSFNNLNLGLWTPSDWKNEGIC